MNILRNAALAFCVLGLVLVPAAGFGLHSVQLQTQGNCSIWKASKDHWSGLASIQAALGCCPDPSARKYHSLNSLAGNLQPTDRTWFSDPEAVRALLENPKLSPCGHWVDFSKSDKKVLVGQMLYYMSVYQYLTPAFIAGIEAPPQRTKAPRWVTVTGFTTDRDPALGGTVNLQTISFFDHVAKGKGSVMVTGTIWLNEKLYWGAPVDNPSSRWHGQYVAIIEPPAVEVEVAVAPWIREGVVLPPDAIYESARSWLLEMRDLGFAGGQFDVLDTQLAVEMPLLVEAEGYDYYLVPFDDRRLAAVFNAYDGSFEELRLFEEEQVRLADADAVTEELWRTLEENQIDVVSLSQPRLVYGEHASAVGRSAPTWEVSVMIFDGTGERELPLHMDLGGELRSDLHELVRGGLEQGPEELAGAGESQAESRHK